jgi:hypothetical protein
MVNPAGDEAFDGVRVEDNFEVQREPFAESPARQAGEHP